MLQDSAGVALLANDAPDLFGEILPEDHLSQPGLRVGSFQEVGQRAARTADRHRRAPFPQTLGPIDQGAQLLGELAVAELRLVGRDLHGDRKEAVVVALQMRFQQAP